MDPQRKETIVVASAEEKVGLEVEFALGFEFGLPTELILYKAHSVKQERNSEHAEIDWEIRLAINLEGSGTN